MDIRCPLPLESPWSPVGYNVVEVASELVPVVRPLTAEEAAAPRPWLPSSPVGYRISMVAEEVAPRPAKPAAVPEPAPTRRSPRRMHQHKPAAMVWGPITVGAAGVVLFMLTMIAVRISTWTPPERPDPVKIALFEPGGPLHRPAAPQVVLPAVAHEDADDIDPIVPAVPNPDENGACRVDPPARLPDERETFGTSVAFARNVNEGYRLAAEQRKLVFVLHVSGNFEESRFT
jgi:hypothetical protein